MLACEFCGNDEATVHLCTDCLAPHPDGIARQLADELGGEPELHKHLAYNIAEWLGWSRPD